MTSKPTIMRRVKMKDIGNSLKLKEKHLKIILHMYQFSSVQLLSCDPIDCSMPGFPVHHQLPQLTQTHVGDGIQPSHPLLSPFPPTFNLSQHQGIFQ